MRIMLKLLRVAVGNCAFFACCALALGVFLAIGAVWMVFDWPRRVIEWVRA